MKNNTNPQQTLNLNKINDHYSNFNYFLCLILIFWLIFKLYYSYDLNSFVSLESNVEWRFVGNSDLTKITESVLADGWKEYVIDPKYWNIFNPYSNPYWSDYNTPLSKYYIENLQTGIVEPLQKVWPIANSQLEGLGLPSLPIKKECVHGLNILHEKYLNAHNSLANQNNSVLNILRENKMSASASERVADWIQDQKKYNFSKNERFSDWVFIHNKYLHLYK
jgi:hypothetical protein